MPVKKGTCAFLVTKRFSVIIDAHVHLTISPTVTDSAYAGGTATRW